MQFSNVYYEERQEDIFMHCLVSNLCNFPSTKELSLIGFPLLLFIIHLSVFVFLYWHYILTAIIKFCSLFACVYFSTNCSLNFAGMVLVMKLPLILMLLPLSQSGVVLST